MKPLVIFVLISLVAISPPLILALADALIRRAPCHYPAMVTGPAPGPSQFFALKSENCRDKPKAVHLTIGRNAHSDSAGRNMIAVGPDIGWSAHSKDGFLVVVVPAGVSTLRCHPPRHSYLAFRRRDGGDLVICKRNDSGYYWSDVNLG